MAGITNYPSTLFCFFFWLIFLRGLVTTPGTPASNDLHVYRYCPLPPTLLSFHFHDHRNPSSIKWFIWSCLVLKLNFFKCFRLFPFWFKHVFSLFSLFCKLTRNHHSLHYCLLVNLNLLLKFLGDPN